VLPHGCRVEAKAEARILNTVRRPPASRALSDVRVLQPSTRNSLFVEPNPTLRTVLAQRLRQDGYLAAAVPALLKRFSFVRSDSRSVGQCRVARRRVQPSAWPPSALPVMVLTARTGADPVVAMLDAGADTSLRKPFAWKNWRPVAESLFAAKVGSGSLQETGLALAPWRSICCFAPG